MSINSFKNPCSIHEFADNLKREAKNIKHLLSDPEFTFEMQRLIEESMRRYEDISFQKEVVLVTDFGGKNTEGKVVPPKYKFKLQSQIRDNWNKLDEGGFCKNSLLETDQWIPSSDDISQIFEVLAHDHRIPWNFGDDCNIRARLAVQILLSMKLDPSCIQKHFCFGKLKNNWQFHVATSLKDENGMDWILDPALCHEAVSLEHWISLVNTRKLPVHKLENLVPGEQKVEDNEILVFDAPHTENLTSIDGCIIDEQITTDPKFEFLGFRLVHLQKKLFPDYAPLIEEIWPKRFLGLEYYYDNEEKNHNIAIKKLIKNNFIPLPEQISDISPQIILKPHQENLRREMSSSFPPDFFRPLYPDAKTSIETVCRHLEEKLILARTLSKEDLDFFETAVSEKKIDLQKALDEHLTELNNYLES